MSVQLSKGKLYFLEIWLNHELRKTKVPTRDAGKNSASNML
jgi:hypothetical protein